RGRRLRGVGARRRSLGGGRRGDGALLELGLERPDPLDDRVELRVRDHACGRELVGLLAELHVCLAALALRLNLPDPLRRLRGRHLCLLLDLVQKAHVSLLYPPRMFPRRPLPPFSPPPCAASSTRSAVRWNGSVWRVTWPGP